MAAADGDSTGTPAHELWPAELSEDEKIARLRNLPSEREAMVGRDAQGGPAALPALTSTVNGLLELQRVSAINLRMKALE